MVYLRALLLLSIFISPLSSAGKTAQEVAEEQAKDLPITLNKCAQIASNVGFDKTIIVTMVMNFKCIVQAANPGVDIEPSKEYIKEFADFFTDQYTKNPGNSYCFIIQSDEYEIDVFNIVVKDRINGIELNIIVDNKVCKSSNFSSP